MIAIRDTKSNPRRAVLGALLVAAFTACTGATNEATLQSVAIGNGRAYLAVGAPKQLALTGQYSDGGVTELTSGVTWTSSDESVASVDATTGIVMPWEQGTAQITATHQASGLTATLELTTRTVVSLKASSGAASAAGTVDTTTTYFRVAGLTPGAVYTTTVSGMTDDVDLAVYSDASMAAEARQCSSTAVGTIDEACEARANPVGELWLAIDGQWTRAGATFTLAVAPTPPPPLAGTLAYPAQLPFAGSVGRTRQYYAVTGLTPDAKYEVRISGLTADLDLEVYADRYRDTSLCESYRSGTEDDACDVTSATTELLVEIDGETSPGGGSFTLSVTPR